MSSVGGMSRSMRRALTACLSMASMGRSSRSHREMLSPVLANFLANSVWVRPSASIA